MEEPIKLIDANWYNRFYLPVLFNVVGVFTWQQQFLYVCEGKRDIVYTL